MQLLFLGAVLARIIQASDSLHRFSNCPSLKWQNPKNVVQFSPRLKITFEQRSSWPDYWFASMVARGTFKGTSFHTWGAALELPWGVLYLLPITLDIRLRHPLPWETKSLVALGSAGLSIRKTSTYRKIRSFCPRRSPVFRTDQKGLGE